MLYGKQDTLLEDVPASIPAGVADIDMAFVLAPESDVDYSHAKPPLSNNDDWGAWCLWKSRKYNELQDRRTLWNDGPYEAAGELASAEEAPTGGDEGNAAGAQPTDKESTRSAIELTGLDIDAPAEGKCTARPEQAETITGC
jgi:hypothetical protein